MTDYNELVRCGECKFWNETEKGFGGCLKSGFQTPKDFLGEDGERKDQGMTDYPELVKALRCKSLSKQCDSCKYGYRLCPDSECNDACDVEQVYADAAAAIEEYCPDCVYNAEEQLIRAVEKWVDPDYIELLRSEYNDLDYIMGDSTE